MRYEEVKAKTLLSKPIIADSWFHTNRSMNIYRGCEHGCVYCDGFCQYYRVDDFYTHIRVKVNAAEILRKELKRMGYTSQTTLETETLWPFLDPDDAVRLAMKTPRKIVIGACGGVSDSYQQAEREYKVTRKVLETLLDFQMPVMILTKSDLVLRDLDILKEIQKVAFANIVFTITLADEGKQNIFEPKSSTTSERFDALREIRKEGIHGAVMSTPIIPWIGDSVENMTALAEESKRANAEYIQFGGMTLKPGRQKEYFLRILKTHFPEEYGPFIKAYSNDHKYGIPIWKQLRVNIMRQGYEICKKIGIRDRSVRHILPSAHEINYKVLSVLLDILFYQSYMYGMSRSNSKPFYELAATLEKGVENLQQLKEDGILGKRLLLDEKMEKIVEEIMETGSCAYIRNLLEIDSSETSGDQVFEATSVS